MGARYRAARADGRYSRRVDTRTLTLVAGEHVTEVEAAIEAAGTIRLPSDELARVAGWELRDEGLCRGDVCVPVVDRAALVTDGTVSLAGLADALHRPLATEPEAALAVMGEPVDAFAGDGDRFGAPSFTLPDVDGRPVSLDDYAGRKRLLVFWSSW
jgi:hypothetical protein